MCSHVNSLDSAEGIKDHNIYFESTELESILFLLTKKNRALSTVHHELVFGWLLCRPTLPYRSSHRLSFRWILFILPVPPSSTSYILMCRPHLHSPYISVLLYNTSYGPRPLYASTRTNTSVLTLNLFWSSSDIVRIVPWASSLTGIYVKFTVFRGKKINVISFIKVLISLERDLHNALGGIFLLILSSNAFKADAFFRVLFTYLR